MDLDSNRFASRIGVVLAEDHPNYLCPYLWIFEIAIKLGHK
jgi:hypothetical protein